jgi:type I restriction enzyme M protein
MRITATKKPRFNMKLTEILKSDTNALKLFSSQQIQQLEASLFADDKNEKFYLTCLRRNRKIQVYSPSKTNPEEIIRQLYILKLKQEYGYPIENMELEVSVQMGSASKKDKENIVLIIEVKKPKVRRLPHLFCHQYQASKR